MRPPDARIGRFLVLEYAKFLTKYYSIDCPFCQVIYTFRQNSHFGAEVGKCFIPMERKKNSFLAT
jgi:hypothetical protein